MTITIPRDFAGAREMLRGKDARVIGYATALETMGDDAIGLRHHATVIAVFRADGTLALTPGAWRTATTKRRLNDALGWRGGIGSVRGVWHYWRRGPLPRPAPIPFFNGLTVNDTGEPVNAEPDAERAARDADAATVRAIGKYARKLTAERIAEAIASEAGDCFGCRWPDALGADGWHLREHIRENYYPARLLARAIERAGYRPDVYLAPEMGADWAVAVVRKCLRRYLVGALTTTREGMRGERYAAG